MENYLHLNGLPVLPRLFINMHLTLPEQFIVKCICLSKVPVTYSYLVNNTRLDMATIKISLHKLIATGRVEIGLHGGFSITKEAKKHPLIRRILQDLSEDRLLLNASRYHYRSKQVQSFLRSNRYAVYSWAKILKRLAAHISKAK